MLLPLPWLPLALVADDTRPRRVVDCDDDDDEGGDDDDLATDRRALVLCERAGATDVVAAAAVVAVPADFSSMARAMARMEKRDVDVDDDANERRELECDRVPPSPPSWLLPLVLEAAARSSLSWPVSVSAVMVASSAGATEKANSDSDTPWASVCAA